MLQFVLLQAMLAAPGINVVPGLTNPGFSVPPAGFRLAPRATEHQVPKILHNSSSQTRPAPFLLHCCVRNNKAGWGCQQPEGRRAFPCISLPAFLARAAHHLSLNSFALLWVGFGVQRDDSFGERNFVAACVKQEGVCVVLAWHWRGWIYYLYVCYDVDRQWMDLLELVLLLGV